jgi:hypothetical protein
MLRWVQARVRSASGIVLNRVEGLGGSFALAGITEVDLPLVRVRKLTGRMKYRFQFSAFFLHG